MTLQKIYLLLTLVFVGYTAMAQSAVYVYKDTEKGKGDYVFVYGMPSLEEAEDTAEGRIAELQYDFQKIRKYASTDRKGHGVIIRSVFPNNNVLMVVYGAALGSSSYEEAEQKAKENMEQFNDEWDPNKHSYKIIQQFHDEH